MRCNTTCNLLTIMWLLAVWAMGCGDGEAAAPSDEPKAELKNAGADTESGADTGGGEVTVVDPLLLDDCADSDPVNAVGGIWIAYDDSLGAEETGESEVWPVSVYRDGVFEMSEPGYGDQGYAARMIGTTGIVLGWDYLGLYMSLGPDSFCPDPQPAEIDLLQYDGIRFMAKGSRTGGEIWLMLQHGKDGPEENCDNGLIGNTLTEWGDYYINIEREITEEWTQISVDFADLEQPYWVTGNAKVDINTVLEHLKGIVWQYVDPDGGEVDLWLDEIELYRESDHGE
jgi:hypothetical protein